MKIYFTFLTVFLFNLGMFAQAPSISAFSPIVGPVGTTVTITGTSFSTTPANNIVFFGAVRAAVSTSTATSLNVKVPAGATYQPITVTINSLTAYSAGVFTVIFNGASANFSTSSFVPKTDYVSAKGPSCVATGDFDGDGKPDLVSVNDSSNTFSVFINLATKGNIAFSPKKDFITGTTPYAVSVGDLDGDGKLDIVIANGGSNTISVFRNTSTGIGNISFAAKVDLLSATYSFCTVIRDFDGDGKPDIAAANSNNSSVSIFKNNGGPGALSFSSKIDFVTGASPYWLDAGDLDNDGKPDLATANGNALNSVSILRNTSTPGNISFAPKTDLDGGGNSYSIIIKDLNADGKPDLTVGNIISPSIAVLANTSTTAGNISFAPKLTLYAGLTFGVTVGDMNGDGKPDIIVANRTSNSVSVLKNTSLNTFISFDPKTDFSVGFEPWVAAVADLDGDDKPDIVTANYKSGNISVLRNKVNEPVITSFDPTSGGNGAVINITGTNFTGTSTVYFGTTRADSFKVLSPTNIVATVGTGGSGKVLVTATYGSDSMAGFTYTTNPTISSFTPTSGGAGTVVNISGTNLNSVTSVKFGNASAASFHINSPVSISAVAGTPDSLFMQVTVTNPGGTAFRNGFYTGPSITSFSPKSGPVGTIVTINGYQFNTVIAGNKVFFGAAAATVLEATSKSLKVRVPAYASFDPIIVISSSLTAASKEPFIVSSATGSHPFTSNSLVFKGDSAAAAFPLGIAKGDFDRDGKTDIVTANFVSGSISILQNRSEPGYIAFKSKIDIETLSSPVKVATEDVDADGKADILILNREHNFVSIFRNISTIGSIAFAPVVEFACGDSPIDMVTRDIDGDGKPDLVISSEGSSTITLLRNTSIVSTISMEAPIGFFLPGTSGGLATGDVNNDGSPDIVVAYDGGFVPFINRSTAGEIFTAASLERQTPVPTGASLQSIAIADIDGDGFLDVAVGSKGYEAVIVHKNTSSSAGISFANGVYYNIGDNSSNPNQVKVVFADMDGDGKADIFFPGHGNTNSLLRNTSAPGNVTFAQQIDCFAGNAAGFLRRYVITDLDGDGKPDLAVGDQSANGIAFFRNRVGEEYSMCTGSSMFFTAGIKGLNYWWQVDMGSGFADISSDDNNYGGINEEVLELRSVPSTLYGYQYRCVVDGINDQPVTVTFTDYWTGSSNADWGDPRNWSCSNIPDSNTDVVIDKGSITINTNVTVRSIKINPGASVTVNTGFHLTVLH